MWTDRKCPYLSTRGCRLAAEVAGLPIETCSVTAEQCATCLNDHEPTARQPNLIVGQIARNAIQQHQPNRLHAFAGRHNIPEVEPAPLTEESFPCVHRGEKLRDHACAPCRGGRVHSVHHCNLLGRECTPLASDAIGADGKVAEFCLVCDKRQVRARERDKRIGYIKNTQGEDCGKAWAGRFDGSVFLVCGGPSLNQMDLSILNQRGIMVAAVNNVAASHVRPHLWISGDRPGQFHQAIWADPAIAKFTKFPRVSTRRLEGEKSIPGPAAFEYPNVWQYEVDRSDLKAAYYLTLPAPIWPSSGRKSVMLPALRMLIDFGFKTIYLLGCDFKMQPGLATDGEVENFPGSYAFDEGKNDEACRSNNNLFASIDAFFHKLNPILKGSGIEVRNCTPGGYMTGFERMPFHLAVDTALAEFPKVESLFGYYWRAA